MNENAIIPTSNPTFLGAALTSASIPDSTPSESSPNFVAKPATALTEAQLQELDEMLAKTGHDECMSAEEFDGFCCALVCCTERISRDEWFSEVLGEPLTLTKTRIGPKRFASLQELAEQHLRSVRQQLEAGESFAPVVNRDDQGRAYGYGWAIGFACGMGLRPDSWDAIEDNDDLAESFVPIMDLVDEAHETGDHPPELSPAQCDERFNTMLDGIFDAYSFFHGQQVEAAKKGPGKGPAAGAKGAGSKSAGSKKGAPKRPR